MMDNNNVFSNELYNPDLNITAGISEQTKHV